jgi:hypothetical protein
MMATTNEITGDALVSRLNSEEFEKNFDKIFGEKPKKPRWVPPPLPLNEYPETSWDNGEQRIENIGRNSNEGLHYK